MAEAGGLRSRWRSASLGAKLVLFSAVLTAVSVLAAFLALDIEIRRNVRELLATTLAHHQRMLLNLQKRDLEQLVRTSTLMTDSPTLRAAMETYRSEAAPGVHVRSDLLATIKNEAAKIAAGLARDLLIVTDSEGKVLASGGRAASGPLAGANLASRPVLRRALAQDAPVGPQNFAVMRFGDRYFQVGCVPILLQGYVIGALALGDRIDGAYVARLRESFDSDIVVTAGERVLGSTLEAALPAGSSVAIPESAGARSPVLPIGRDEYVAAPLSLNSDQAGLPVTVVLLHSLTRALAPLNQSLLWTLLSCGSLAVILAGAAASMMSRSVLRPLEGFVAFMRSVAETGDHAHRFESSNAGVEVRVLSDTYNQLMESLHQHEQRILKTAREELDRLERLKESEKLAALGRLLSGAAHEINNPLTGVVGNVEILLDREKLPDAVRQRLETVRREGQRIVALVRNLLKVAHRGGGERTPLDVNQVIRDTVAVRRHDFEKAGMTIELDLAASGVTLSASELELQQVFLNIINNAHDALRTTTSHPTLSIRTIPGSGEVTIVFSDNGPGIEEPARVFEHFYTTKPVGQGTGLGLSITTGRREARDSRSCCPAAPRSGPPRRAARGPGRLPSRPPGAPCRRRCWSSTTSRTWWSCRWPFSTRSGRRRSGSARGRKRSSCCGAGTSTSSSPI
ncbi:MAG: hypothetical protein AUI47_09095 [Acidobacteria bacterium 13_1_40CM_2_68_5]|nr:MAG: hypothetical protein AUI47_09095 [Acidobacteria bacterium 13_1_40CM_2_68_5]